MTSKPKTDVEKRQELRALLRKARELSEEISDFSPKFKLELCVEEEVSLAEEKTKYANFRFSPHVVNIKTLECGYCQLLEKITSPRNKNYDEDDSLKEKFRSAFVEDVEYKHHTFRDVDVARFFDIHDDEEIVIDEEGEGSQ